MTVMWVVLAQIVVSAAPPLPPAEAAAIMARLDSPANVTGRVLWPAADGPLVVIVGSSPTAGPFGEFAPFPPSFPLDGTWLRQRPAVYGRAFVHPFGGRPFELRSPQHGQHLPTHEFALQPRLGPRAPLPRRRDGAARGLTGAGSAR
jgi:hypothetical protein